MSKFNTKSTRTASITRNNEGGVSYSFGDKKQELASVILSSMLANDSFYQSGDDRIAQIFKLAEALKDKEFLAKAMVFVRQEGNLRSVSHVLANALVENTKGKDYVRKAVRMALVRPDDMTEMAALWWERHQGVMLPNSMRRAFKDALESNQWDAYQLRKYAKSRSSVKLKDIVKVSHPKDRKGLMTGVITDTLSVADTVETRLSAGESASKAFSDLLSENRLGYMVAIKNVVKGEVGLDSSDFDRLCNMIANKERVRKSRVLPMRLVQAWYAVKASNMHISRKNKLFNAFNSAIMASAHNLDLRNKDESVAVILDSSGSMGRFNPEGKNAWSLGLPIAAALAYAFDNVHFYLFDSSAKVVNIRAYNGPLGLIDNTYPNGGATHFHAPLELMIGKRVKVDKVVMFSDMQLYSADYGYNRHAVESFDIYWKKYRNEVNPHVKMLFWNLEGYGTTPLNTSRPEVLEVSGYSDQLLQVVPHIFEDRNYLVKRIEAVNI